MPKLPIIVFSPRDADNNSPSHPNNLRFQLSPKNPISLPPAPSPQNSSAGSISPIRLRVPPPLEICGQTHRARGQAYIEKPAPAAPPKNGRRLWGRKRYGAPQNQQTICAPARASESRRRSDVSYRSGVRVCVWVCAAQCRVRPVRV